MPKETFFNLPSEKRERLIAQLDIDRIVGADVAALAAVA